MMEGKELLALVRELGSLAVLAVLILRVLPNFLTNFTNELRGVRKELHALRRVLIQADPRAVQKLDGLDGQKQKGG